MQSFPAPALAMVEQMQAAAAADPERAIAFQGAPGANSHRAANEWAPEALPLPCFSFADAIDAVKDGRAGCAMIPIENSQAGRVADIHFLLPESGLSIVGEHFLRISHALMAIRGATGPFQAAYSHPHALAQSRHFLRERGMVPLSFADTAGAAAYVAEMGDPSVAAISPALAADLYGLERGSGQAVAMEVDLAAVGFDTNKRFAEKARVVRFGAPKVRTTAQCNSKT